MDRTPPSHSTVPKTSGMAITSLVLGVSSFFCWIFTGLPAIVLGIVSLLKINRSEGRLKGEGMAIAGMITGGLSTLMVFPIMLALLLPAVQAAREAARRNISQNNMKQLVLGMILYEQQNKSYPVAGEGAEPGSQLSWRVHILPYIEGGSLYDQFHLDEPWDSEHNRGLIQHMPEIFEDPNMRPPPGETAYLAVTGADTVMGDGSAAKSARDITDGASNTIMIVEADPDQSVVWTKPDDWEFDSNDPVRGLGKSRIRGFLAAFADGSVQFIDFDTIPDVIRALMTSAGGEQVR